METRIVKGWVGWGGGQFICHVGTNTALWSEPQWLFQIQLVFFSGLR